MGFLVRNWKAGADLSFWPVRADQVQFYVYDSAGASTKSPHIPVRVKTDSSSDNTSSKSGESRTKQSVTSEAAETYSDSKATLEEGGGNEIVVKSTETTTTSTATGTRSGYALHELISLAPFKKRADQNLRLQTDPDGATTVVLRIRIDDHAFERICYLVLLYRSDERCCRA